MRGSYGYTRDNDNMGQDMLNMTGQFQRQWENLDDYINQEQVQASQNKLLQRMKERGGDLSGLSFNDVDNIYDMQAIGLLQQQNSQNEQYRLQGMKNRDASDTEFYNQKIYPTMALIQQAYEKGDVQSFDVLTQQLGNLMGTPYRYKLSADGQGFDEYFRSDAAMGFAPTGRKMSRDDVYKMVRQTADGTMFYMGGIGGQRVAFNPQYNMWAERQRQATARGNIESAMNPKPMVGPDGKLYYGAPQNKWGDYNADTDVVLFNQSGQKVGVVGASRLAREGFRWAGGAVGRSGRGGRGGSGSGESGGAPAVPGAQGGMRPVYKLSETDKKNILKWSTTGDPEDGGSVDYGRAAFMENLTARTGSFAQSVNLIQGLAQQARQRNPQLSPEDAERAAMAFLNQRMNGAAPAQPQAQGAPVGAPAGAPAAAQPTPMAAPNIAPQVAGPDAQFAGGGQAMLAKQREAAQIDAQLAAAQAGFDPADYGAGTVQPGASTDMFEGYYGNRARAAQEDYRRRIQEPLAGVGFFGY
ncbi:hypothetical protein [uncultured Desulfovibrio sp.]|uniref:hypothetical protein n=1 Tax=uncultured Desulfovibrio sp. TaxID=167968 RepID=UPI002617C859|nr:hypothetical protein [uncultured Desulfovibrio sp.]